MDFILCGLCLERNPGATRGFTVFDCRVAKHYCSFDLLSTDWLFSGVRIDSRLTEQ